MNILPENGLMNLFDTKTSEANANSLKNQQGWLREWEQAQWRTEAQRDNPAAEEKPPQTSLDGEAAKSEFRIVNENESVTRTVSADKSSMSSATAQAGTSVHAAPNALAIAPNNVNVGATSYGAATSWIYSPLPPNALTEVMATTRYVNLSMRLTEWQPYLLHVIAHSAGMRVWVRDKRLKDLSDHDLLAKIKQELAAQGLKLASLTVNGREIWKMDSLRDEDLAPLDGNSTSVLDRTY